MDAERLNRVLKLWDMIQGFSTDGDVIVALYDALEDAETIGFSKGADWMQAETEASEESDVEAGFEEGLEKGANEAGEAKVNAQIEGVYFEAIPAFLQKPCDTE